MVASIFLAGRDWLWPALCAGVAASLAIAWSYSRGPGSGAFRTACAGLKFTGITALLGCLLEPTWSGQRAKPGANLLAIIADNSASMTLPSAAGSPSRGEELQRLLTGDRSAWRARLARDFEARGYSADSRLRAMSDFRELTFEGRHSALGGALHQFAERHRGQALAGVILLTDGVAADLDVAALKNLPPIYPVVFGGEETPRDVAIANTRVSQTSFEDAPVTIEAELLASEFAGEEMHAALFLAGPTSGEAKPISEQRLAVPHDGRKFTASFQLRPEKTGVLFYRLHVSPTKSQRPEVTLVNNETTITVDRGTGPHRVLYVSGRPNWEYKFLQRAVAGDDQTQLVGLIRVAKREAKFEFRGRAGESSNPLFRGFGDGGKEETERYDQPVLVRLNTEDEFELRDGFPKTAEELFRYRAVIIDDVEAEFFTRDQMSLLQRFVSERGGGFLMLGGTESFAGGNYERTPIGDMLPVYLRGQESGDRGQEQWRFSLTREGWFEHWARLRSSESEERKRLGEVPAFDVLNRVGGAKPAATVVGLAGDGPGEAPALVAQRFGRGRTAALMLGDFWQSGLGDEARQKDLGKAWRQIVRWLVADVPQPIAVRAEPQAAGESVRLEVRARDGKFLPLENATVTLTVQALAGAEPVTLTAEPAASEAGVYEAVFVPRDSGAYRVNATVLNESGVAAGTAETGWSTDFAAAEFRSLVPNRALMESLANKTGGQVLSPAQLPAFARELPAKRAPVTETWTQPLWHTPLVFLFSLGCFVAEWGLRRWKGLA